MTAVDEHLLTLDKNSHYSSTSNHHSRLFAKHYWNQLTFWQKNSFRWQ